MASTSAAMATGSPWKLPPESSSPVSAKTIGLSVAAFISTLDRARRRSRARRATAPWTCGHAAQAVGVLHLAAVAVRLADARCPRAAARRLRAEAAWPGCGRAAWMRGSKATSVPLSASRVRAPDHVGACARAARPRPGRGPPTAVMSCVPLMRARPSLASSTTGARPGGRAAPPPPAPAPPVVTALAFADERQRQVGERRQVAAGADASPATGRPGWMPRVQHRDQQVEGLGPHAAEALGQHVRAQQHERARLRLVERLADARGVAAHQVQLQLAQLVARDHDVGEVAEAGGDAVDDVAARHRVVHHARARAATALARRRRERDRAGRRAPPPRGRRGSRLCAVEQERGIGGGSHRRAPRL